MVEVWIRCGGGSDSDWVQDMTRQFPWSPQQSKAAGLWSRALYTTSQFSGAPWSCPRENGFPRAAGLVFHLPFGLEHGFSTSALLIFWVERGCPVHCRCSAASLASSPLLQQLKCLQGKSLVPCEVKLPLVKNHRFTERFSS